MQENEKNIDNQLKNMLSDYLETPRPEAWEGVRNSIAQAREDRHKRSFLFYRWWFIVALLLLMAVATVVAYRYYNEDTITANKQNSIGERAVVSCNQEQGAAKGNIIQNTDAGSAAENKQSLQKDEDEEEEATAPRQVINNKSANSKYTKGAQGVSRSGALPIANAGATTSNETNSFSPNVEPISKQQPKERKTEVISPLNTVASLEIRLPQEGIGTPENTASLPMLAEPALLQQQVNLVSSEQKGNGVIPGADVQEETKPDNLVAKSGDETNMPDMAKEVINPSGVPENVTQESKAKERLKDTVTTRGDTDSKQNAAEDIAKTPELKKANYGFLNKISAGAKLGYQSSFTTTNNADKYVFAGFVEYNVTDNLTVMLQPAYLTGKAVIVSKANEQVYYNITSANVDTSSIVYYSNNIRDPDTIYRTYDYRATYDSTRVSAELSDTKLWDIEIPVVFKYRIFKGCSIMAGGIGTFSKTLGYTEERMDYTNQQFNYTEDFEPVIVAFGEPAPPPPDVKSLNELYTFTGERIENYKPMETSNVQSFFRWGYTIGVSVELKKRLLMDVSMLQMPAFNLNNDADIKELYTKPYFRLMIGYKIKK